MQNAHIWALRARRTDPTFRILDLTAQDVAVSQLEHLSNFWCGLLSCHAQCQAFTKNPTSTSAERSPEAATFDRRSGVANLLLSRHLESAIMGGTVRLNLLDNQYF